MDVDEWAGCNFKGRLTTGTRRTKGNKSDAPSCANP